MQIDVQLVPRETPCLTKLHVLTWTYIYITRQHVLTWTYIYMTKLHVLTWAYIHNVHVSWRMVEGAVLEQVFAVRDEGLEAIGKWQVPFVTAEPSAAC